MQAVGTLLLHVVFVLTAATGALGIAAAVLRDARLLVGVRAALFALFALSLAMAGVLWHGYFSHDFASKYIATYSDRDMPPIYLFTSFWGGEKGALLFWATMLTGFSAVAVHQARDRDVAYVGWASAILCGAILFYDVLMVFESNPFELFRTQLGPADGRGLNPLLQNPTMAIHPPSLLTGYIAFTIPFAFGAASLITGRLGDQWARDTRKWTIVSWLFLSTGLVLGGAWAYQELGWGGFWMWDPVENAGLIPWFTATAFLHSIIVQERYEMLRRWNFSLVCLTCFLTIFGTFLTRSQLIVSIHAFADSKLSEYFLWYMGGLAAVSAALLIWRWRALAATTRIESFLSREAMFVLNNVLLLLCAFIVMWGTLYSKISEAAAFRAIYNGVAEALSYVGIAMDTIHHKQELGEPWFNAVMVPAGVALLMLTGLGPLFAWRRTKGAALRRTFLLPFVLTVLPMAAIVVATAWWRCHAIAQTIDGSLSDGWALWVLTLENTDYYAFVGIGFAWFVLAGVAVEFWKGGRIRQKKRGGGLTANIFVLVLRSKRRYVGYIVHVGLALMFVGFAGAAFKKSVPETALHPGAQLKVGGYSLTYASSHDVYEDGQGYAASRAAIVVQEAGETVPVEAVDRLAAWVEQRSLGPVHLETKTDSPKVLLRFASPEARDRARSELYVASVLKRRFSVLPPRKGQDSSTLRLGFADSRLVQSFPFFIHKHVDDLRRNLGGLQYGRARVESRPGQAEITLNFENAADASRVAAQLREPPALEGVMMCTLNAALDGVEVILEGTGKVLSPEVRRYLKHMNPTTEVAIWSRIHEDVYIAMRPDMGQSFVNVLAFVNPLINLVWLGTVIMFLGGLLLLAPTDWLIAESAASAPAEPPPAASSGAMAAARSTGAGVLLLLILGALAAPERAQAQGAPEPARAQGAPTARGQGAPELMRALRCVCEEGGEPTVDPTRTLRDCTCPYGASVRARLEAALAADGSRAAQVKVLGEFVEEDPSNERFLTYDTAAHSDLMTNTWCTCGCGKMALSQCPLDCPWSPHFKRVFKVLLTIGYSREEARVHYLEEINVAHRKAEEPRFTLEQIWLNRDPKLSWGVPVALAVVATVVIAGVVARRLRQSAPAPVVAAGPERSEAYRSDIDDLGV